MTWSPPDYQTEPEPEPLRRSIKLIIIGTFTLSTNDGKNCMGGFFSPLGAFFLCVQNEFTFSPCGGHFFYVWGGLFLHGGGHFWACPS